jgi:excinuclease ABC subunit C
MSIGCIDTACCGHTLYCKMTESLKQKIAHLPKRPGVYLMKGHDGRVLYVGKAKDLRKRVLSYFNRDNHTSLKTAVLVDKIADLETMVTLTEKEALILESNLIKRYRPRYNVILKDDKRYPCLRLDTKALFPNLTVARKFKKDGAQYFGPFASAGAVRETLKLIHRTFKLRKCKGKKPDKRDRPCLNYQMGLCLAPCCQLVDRDEYMKAVKEVSLFLKGRMPQLLNQVRRDMEEAAERQEFEVAAAERDRLYALEKTLEKQVVTTSDLKDRDVVGIARRGKAVLVMVLFIRGGFLMGSRPFFFTESETSDREVVESFVKQYYDDTSFVPSEVMLPMAIGDKAILEERLTELRASKVAVLVPRRGEKARLMDMAAENAQKALEEKMRAVMLEEGMLDRVKKALALSRRPDRIECIDLSNIAGTEGVGAVVVFDRGKPDPKAYRKYRIKTASADDDYGMLKEVVSRRYKPSEPKQKMPDLLIVDGGKGQLNLTVLALKKRNVWGVFDVVAIAKKEVEKGETEDKIFKPGRKNPLGMKRYPDVLLFLQRIRDEAHRFVIRYHRKRRMKTYRSSVLEGISGIGPKRRTALLKHFGSVQRLKTGSLEEIMAVPGMTRQAAENLLKALG